jgi:hypothetical protein
MICSPRYCPGTRSGANFSGDLFSFAMTAHHLFACRIAATIFVVSTLTVVTRASRSVTLSL